MVDANAAEIKDHANRIGYFPTGDACFVPGINGFELARQFRANGGTTPILMLTGNDSMVDKRIGFNSGAAGSGKTPAMTGAKTVRRNGRAATTQIISQLVPRNIPPRTSVK